MGHAVDAGRRDRQPGHRCPASTRADRHRPTRRVRAGQTRRARRARRAAQLPEVDVRSDRRGPRPRRRPGDPRRAPPRRRANGSIPGSAHIPINELLERLAEVPDGELWVHCAAGFRAGIGASLLARAGRTVVLVDDDYSSAVASGLATG
ncbi:rhodanese-like domain-containing protein [Pseudonocardia sp. N23]|uniref:rhodanese-like domain-containing protein n=1 Tax=Pseudonocardia sp. N23 TaxID=1987376 RepID=UPI0035B5FF68